VAYEALGYKQRWADERAGRRASRRPKSNSFNVVLKTQAVSIYNKDPHLQPLQYSIPASVSFSTITTIITHFYLTVRSLYSGIKFQKIYKECIE